MIGESFGGYTILSRIGAGGMGEVYLGEHRRIQRRAAIKVLRRELSGDPALLERFFNEARTTSEIRHPNIVEIIDCDVHPVLGSAYIVMEFLAGESLGDYLARTGPLADRAGIAAYLCAQVACGLEAAHQQGVVHRDLKPDNVFLVPTDGDVTAKVLDFGIAKLLSRESEGGSRTQTGLILGSPLYMSAEQCRGDGLIDARSDIYSLGCMLFEMLCGRPPFNNQFMGEVLAAHIMTPPPAPSSLISGIPAELEQLTLAMLAKDPALRPQSVSEVRAALSQFVVTPGERTAIAIARPASVAPPALEARASARPSPLATPSTLRGSWTSKDIPVNPSPLRSKVTLVVGAVALLALGAFGATRLTSHPSLVAPSGLPSGATSAAIAAPPAAPAESEVVPGLPVAVEAKSVTLTLSSRPPGARVWLDHEVDPRGVTPLTLEVTSESDHKLSLRAKGYRDKQATFHPTGNQSLTLDLEPARPTSGKSSGKGTPEQGYKLIED